MYLKKLVDFGQCQFLAGDRLDCHDYQGNVAVGWLLLSADTWEQNKCTLYKELIFITKYLNN